MEPWQGTIGWEVGGDYEIVSCLGHQIPIVSEWALILTAWEGRSSSLLNKIMPVPFIFLTSEFSLEMWESGSRDGSDLFAHLLLDQGRAVSKVFTSPIYYFWKSFSLMLIPLVD